MNVARRDAPSGGSSGRDAVGEKELEQLTEWCAARSPRARRCARQIALPRMGLPHAMGLQLS
eukprot:6822548-Prymnesium_polylepis.1